ncbi:MFS transporter [Akkermansia sp. N21116]|jgi:DHA1 family inner membrane transport protein|uniref:MFS transporter n=1 Tax=Akkermansia sp. N21116 TaxID=3040764 RepID=UPI00244E9C38|nr:MFS transporter [Akkermansia sp. N21116]WPX41153.1 MFS transporter [Akkermansia sp. N21116]
MKQGNNQNKGGPSRLLVFILAVGVFGIINTEMGVVGILPRIAKTFHVSVPFAGWTVSLFALIVALSAPVMPVLFSRINRKAVMLLSLGIFTLSNLVSAFTDSFTIILIARAIPAFLHPVYVSMAFTVSAESVSRPEAPKAVAKIFIGVSAGMVLGVPVTSFIAGAASFSSAMLFFAAVNVLVLTATVLFVPSLPVREGFSYGAQLGVLKKKMIWQSILAVTMINAAMFGFFSYMSDYLGVVTGVSYEVISVVLLVYGLANIIGNILAGRLLTMNAARCAASIPFILLASYTLLFVLGNMPGPAAAIVFVLGILAGIASNSMQYMIMDAAHEAPDFANGLFLTSANLGTTIGTSVCGLFISFFNTRYALLGSLLFLAAGIVFIFLRNRSVITFTS